MNKEQFVDALDGTAAKVKEAFEAGYDAGFQDGKGANSVLSASARDLDNEWKWFQESKQEEA